MSVAAARPRINVFDADGKATATQIALPAVLVSPIRTDIVQFVHTQIAKNRRQAYAVNVDTGHQHSAESWGTGRAVSRIPRIQGSGRAAFGNMCKDGRMFAPTKTWRRWHRKVAVNQRRYAVCSALAASAVPALVMARGHKVDQVPEVPLVVSNAAVDALQTTKDGVALLTALGAYDDVDRAKCSRKIRRGLGKLRNRRYVQRRGPLVVYARNSQITRALRNLPGVELCRVDRLNLLQLAPGGHVGRFIIWTEAAFSRLDKIFGTRTATGEQKTGYRPPRALVANSDLSRVINSSEVQEALRPKQPNGARRSRKKNPLKNLGVMVKLNPYTRVARRQAARAKMLNKANRDKIIAERRAKAKAAAKKHPNKQYREIVLAD